MCVCVCDECSCLWCVCVWSVFGLVACRDCRLQFSCLFLQKASASFIKRHCSFYGKKASDAIYSFGTHAIILTRVQSHLAKATEPSDLDLVQRWFACFVRRKLKLWMAMKIFHLCVFGCETNDSHSWILFLKLPNCRLHIDLGYFVKEIVSSLWWLVWNAKRLRKECVIRKSVETSAT